MSQNIKNNINLPPCGTEINKVIKRAKRHKTPGPDEVPMEVFKEMDEESRRRVLEIINEWWEKEEKDEDFHYVTAYTGIPVVDSVIAMWLLACV